MNAKETVQSTAAALSYQASPAGHVVTVTTLGYAFAQLAVWLLGLAHVPGPPEFVWLVLGGVAATLVIRTLAL